MGRPTSLTPEVERAILGALRGGNYRETAAQAAGIHRNTLRNWIKAGEAGDPDFVEFLCAVEKAEAYGERKLLRHIRAGCDGWQSKAWIMERRWPGRWSGRVRVTVSDHVDQLTAKLKADPELHRKVVDVLAAEEPGSVGASSAH